MSITTGGARTGASPAPTAHAPRADDLRMTRYSDVCGGTDELKRLLVEEPGLAASAAGRATLRSLLDDGMYMLARMEVRLREYQGFCATLERLAQEMRRIEEPRLQDAGVQAEALRALLDAQPQHGATLSETTVREIIDRAEGIRQVANDMEGALRRHKEGAIEAGRAYLRLRGARGWDDGEATLGGGDALAPQDGPGSENLPPAGPQRAGAGEVAKTALPPGVPEAWLPPPPHREMIVDWLRRGRAVILSTEEAARFPVGPQGREPLVQFEDGGVMPLRVVRWSTEVKNFYPLGATPHPRGPLYRRHDGTPPGAS